jgi:RNA polymerase sigma factor (sigma-70 family)
MDNADPHDTSASLIARARAGDSRAVSTLFRRHGEALRRWAHGRLPHWARAANDTADVVQDVLLRTFRRIDRFDNRGRGALRAYLRQSVMNRINDEMRSVLRVPTTEVSEGLLDIADDAPSPFRAAMDAERERHYKKALGSVSEEERLLIVGRLELSYTYEQLALISGRATPEAARLAVRRAVIKLAQRMTSG